MATPASSAGTIAETAWVTMRSTSVPRSIRTLAPSGEIGIAIKGRAKRTPENAAKINLRMPLPQHHYQKNVLAELRTSDDQFMAIHVALRQQKFRRPLLAGHAATTSAS